MTEQEWDAAVEIYVAEMEKAQANGTYVKGWAHSNCDHAYGYCCEAADGTYYGQVGA